MFRQYYCFKLELRIFINDINKLIIIIYSNLNFIYKKNTDKCKFFRFKRNNVFKPKGVDVEIRLI